MLQSDHSPLFGILKEPPFRLLPKFFLRFVPVSVRTKADWDAITRVNYLFGLIAGAEEARRVKSDAICAIEFGVAAGSGLVAMESLAASVEKETGIRIHVIGFNAGSGLPRYRTTIAITLTSGVPGSIGWMWLNFAHNVARPN